MVVSPLLGASASCALDGAISNHGEIPRRPAVHQNGPTSVLHSGSEEYPLDNAHSEAELST